MVYMRAADNENVMLISIQQTINSVWLEIDIFT